MAAKGIQENNKTKERMSENVYAYTSEVVVVGYA